MAIPEIVSTLWGKIEERLVDPLARIEVVLQQVLDIRDSGVVPDDSIGLDQLKADSRAALQAAADLPPVSPDVLADAVVQRDGTGQVAVPAVPAAGGDAAAKSYVDQQVASRATEADIVEAVAGKANTAYVDDELAKKADEAHSHVLDDLQDLSEVGGAVAAAATPAAARAAIGAGTSSLSLGDTASTAKAGDWSPSWSEVGGKPTEYPPGAHGHTLADLPVVIVGHADEIPVPADPGVFYAVVPGA